MLSDFTALNQDMADSTITEANLEKFKALADILTLIFGTEVTTDWL